MKKIRIRLLFAADLMALSLYWALVLFAMRDRIHALYGQYVLFEMASNMRAIAVPLLTLGIGAAFFFRNRLKAWQYLAVSAAAAVITEILGNAVAMALYQQPFRDTAAMLGTSLMLFLYAVVILLLWTVLSTVRGGVIHTVKKNRATPGFWDKQHEYERERLAGGISPPEPVNIYSGSGLPFTAYWLSWLPVCGMAAFYMVGGAARVLRIDNPAVLFPFLAGIGIALSVLIAWARGSIRIEVGGGLIVVKRRGRVSGSYAQKDYTVAAGRTAHLLGGIIPCGTDRYIVLTDKSGKRSWVQCRCFSEKTFAAMADEINAVQRSVTRQEKIENLPAADKDSFVSFSFTINKDQMISAEQKRYRALLLGFPVACVIMYAAWDFFVYRTAPDPIPGLPYITGGVIAVLCFILPAVVMMVRFAQEKKRIPSSITVESDRFIIDNQMFENEHVQKFTMTHPLGAKVGTTSHRMHIVFFYYGIRHVFTIGSGTVKSANFPDYSLLYAAFDAWRIRGEMQQAPRRRERQPCQTTIRLTPFTALTVQASHPAELANLVQSFWR